MCMEWEKRKWEKESKNQREEIQSDVRRWLTRDDGHVPLISSLISPYPFFFFFFFFSFLFHSFLFSRTLSFFILVMSGAPDSLHQPTSIRTNAPLDSRRTGMFLRLLFWQFSVYFLHYRAIHYSIFSSSSTLSPIGSVSTCNSQHFFPFSVRFNLSVCNQRALVTSLFES